MIVKVKSKRNGLCEAGRKLSNPKLLVISACGKVIHKAPVSSICEPGRLILLKVILEMASLSQKSIEKHPDFQLGLEKEPSLLLQTAAHTSPA